ncbi:hypothetical protein H6H03_06530 [Nostoc paludosum FACHB-159]|uniref:Uncharacterized protein n=2 Tax=Nostoc TaxID=1177 RepID=A0ABR8K463_9NOSO|nr:hypothetical protein [Nostoc paludosum FACHB-159]
MGHGAWGIGHWDWKIVFLILFPSPQSLVPSSQSPVPSPQSLVSSP